MNRMVEFSYFVFHPLRLDEVLAQFGERYGLEQIRDLYRSWINIYDRRAYLFHQSQFNRHQIFVERAVCLEHDLNPTRPLFEQVDSDSSIAGRFERALEDYRVPVHQAEVECTYEETERLVKKLGPIPEWKPKELLGRDADLVGDAALGSPKYQIWALWLDKATRVHESEQSALAALPYQEYLESPYWRRFRLAVIIAYGAHCQTLDCRWLGSWWENEGDLNVHHLDYHHKGHEQLNNIRLVCNRCHKLVHSGRDDLFDDCDYLALWS